jgi:peptide/nickel transport system permease protein
MNAKAFLARRAVFSVFVVWLVVTAVWALLVVAPDSELGRRLWFAAVSGANVTELEMLEQEYLAARGQARPLHVRYLDWLVSLATLQWGTSFMSDEPVTSLLGGSLRRSVLYIVPGTVLAVLFGTAVGLYSALRPDSRGEFFARVVAYVAFGVPSFLLGVIAVVTIGDLPEFVTYGRVEQNVWLQHVVPTLLLGATMAGAMVSYTRATTREYVDTAFVKLVRAKGASGRRIAAHVLKNAVPPLFALLFAELLGVLLLGMVVIEEVFQIDGFGRLILQAALDRDVPVLLGATIVVVAVGVIGTFVQDVVSVRIDPRIADE